MKKLIWIALVFTLSACEKSEIKEFSTDDCAVYFQRSGGYSMPADGSVIYAKTYSYVDSMSFSFTTQKNTTKEVTLGVPIVTMGKVKDYDRPVKVVLDEVRTNAVEGVDFEVNLDTVYIPANKSKASLRVRIFRTDVLLTETKRVAFRIVENEHFKLHIQSYKTSSNWQAKADTVSAVQFALVFNEQYSEPSYYTWFGEGFWGKWTPKKYQVLNQVMGWTDSDWDNAGSSGAKVSYGRMSFAARATQRYLQDMADAGTPVLDSDGSYMQLADAYAVDYSKYDIKD